MNPLLDKYLCDKYPKIFVERNQRKSCMSRGFEHADGWFNLLNSLCMSIQSHLDSPTWVKETKLSARIKHWCNTRLGTNFDYDFYRPPTPDERLKQVVFQQVKEKFGGLRIYYEGGDEFTSGMVALAERLSYHICEKCGKFSEAVAPNKKGWVRYTCNKCTPATDKADHELNQNRDLKKIFAIIRKKKSA
jgi:hypothetical protein